MVNLKNKVAYRKSQNYSDYIDITYVEICLVTSNGFSFLSPMLTLIFRLPVSD